MEKGKLAFVAVGGVLVGSGIVYMTTAHMGIGAGLLCVGIVFEILGIRNKKR